VEDYLSSQTKLPPFALSLSDLLSLGPEYREAKSLVDKAGSTPEPFVLQGQAIRNHDFFPSKVWILFSLSPASTHFFVRICYFILFLKSTA